MGSDQSTTLYPLGQGLWRKIGNVRARQNALEQKKLWRTLILPLFFRHKSGTLIGIMARTRCWKNRHPTKHCSRLRDWIDGIIRTNCCTLKNCEVKRSYILNNSSIRAESSSKLVQTRVLVSTQFPLDIENTLWGNFENKGPESLLCWN